MINKTKMIKIFKAKSKLIFIKIYYFLIIDFMSMILEMIFFKRRKQMIKKKLKMIELVENS